MDNKKEDLRITKTKNLIKNSFFSLLAEKGFSKVTITDITTRAMINRNTFYLHYIDKDDLINKIIYDSIKQKEPKIYEIMKETFVMFNDNLSKMQEVIIFKILDLFFDELNLYQIILRDPGLIGCLDRIKNNFKAFMKIPFKESPKHLIAFEFIFEGTYGVITEWIKNGFTSKDNLTKELSLILNLNWQLIFDDNNIINILENMKNIKIAL